MTAARTTHGTRELEAARAEGRREGAAFAAEHIGRLVGQLEELTAEVARLRHALAVREAAGHTANDRVVAA